MEQATQLILPRNELRISITSGCNMQCVYCHNEGNSKPAQLNMDEICAIIDAAKNYGLTSVRLTGGEPLIHPEIEAICRMLAREYGLTIGVNTNGILIDKLLPLIHAGIVRRIVIGIDYFDGVISKQSPVGVPSRTILENALRAKDAGGDVCIDVVYQDNYENIANLVRWGIAHSIRVKIIEEVKQDVQDPSNPSYERMMQAILRQFGLTCIKDAMDESNGYLGAFRAVSFLHSLCRLHDCDSCMLYMPLRVTANAMLKPCIIHTDNDIDLHETGMKNGFEAMLKNDTHGMIRHETR